ncbi:MAG: MFS transporter [Proteobacteria bacterium]|nr:MFS transporter [Pseudomonadota bacterium]
MGQRRESEPRPAGPPLGVGTKLLLGTGDHAVNVTLSALSLVYVWYLAKVVGIAPGLAAAVPLVGRFVDAFTDPLMGRLSDRTRSRFGRRRPYFALGAIPFGLSFALLWVDPGLSGQWTLFAFYCGVYVFYSLASTVVSVPYVAVLPEIVPDFDERTSVNAYRSALTLLGTLLAATGTRPLAQWLGGPEPDFFLMGCAFGVWVTLPWLALFAAVRERGDWTAPARRGWFDGLRLLWTHPDYLRLSGMYLSGRISMDLVGMMLLFFVGDWLGRPGDFEAVAGVFILSAVVVLPLWVRLAERTDKRRAFGYGCLWWGGTMLLFLIADSDFPPRWAAFALVAVSAGGYAVVDMMPWSMLADVVDEDELRSGERREGIYSGFFTFTRKLGGATGVFLAGSVLQLAGYHDGPHPQPESALQAVRWLTAVAPAVFLGIAVWSSRSYRLTRARHAEIVAELESRRTAAAEPA